MGFAERFLSRTVLFELGPTLVFFATNAFWGLAAATAAVMAATLLAVALGIVLDRRVPVIALATLTIVLILGGASLVFDDETFIKIRPTVGSCLFALALLVGLLFKPSFLERALGIQLQLTMKGWRVLTGFWIAFALFLAAINELVWRTMPTDTWVSIKTATAPAALFGYVVITNLTARRYWKIRGDDASRDA